MAREVDAVTNRVALADLSVFSKFDVTGPDTLRFLDALGANTPPKPGRIGLTHALTPAGGVASEFTVTVLRPTAPISTPPRRRRRWTSTSSPPAPRASTSAIRNRTDDLAVIGLMGPRSGDVLARSPA